MCVGTAIRKISTRVSVFAILTALGTGLAYFGGYVSSDAVTKSEVSQLRADKTTNETEHANLQTQITSMNTKLTKIETNTEWIMKTLDKMQ